jgi:cyclic pyranopterin phosphate synthase
VALLDVILTYDCNLACDYCTVSEEMRGRSLSAEAVVEAMRRGRTAGYDAVSFGGGEPTIRRDLPGLVRTARDLGYREIKVQSNGLLFAPERNVARLVAAGVTLFHVSVRTHEEEAFDRMVRRPGAWPLMVKGLDNLVARGVDPRADLIVTSETYRRLPAAVRWLRGHCVRRVNFWFVSLTDANRDNVASMPRMTEATPFLAEALAVARAEGMEARSLHVPRCLLGPDAGHAFDPGSDRVTVLTPDSTFELSDSRIFGRTHVPACEGCTFRGLCPGLRPDYLARYGDGEIVAARAGQPPAPVLAASPVQGGSGASSIS